MNALEKITSLMRTIKEHAKAAHQVGSLSNREVVALQALTTEAERLMKAREEAKSRIGRWLITQDLLSRVRLHYHQWVRKPALLKMLSA